MMDFAPHENDDLRPEVITRRAAMAPETEGTGETRHWASEAVGEPELPAVAEPPDEAFYPIDPRFVRAEQLSDLIVAGALFIGAVIWSGVHAFANGFNGFFYVLAGGSLAVVGVTAWFAVFWPRLTFRYTRWRLDESGLEIRKGVLWRHRIIVPLSRVQHADVSQGPLQRAFGLGTLTVHTAGTTSASVELAGLNHNVAVQVRDVIVRSRSQSRVE